MGKHKKTKRLSIEIERTVETQQSCIKPGKPGETESPDLKDNNKDNNNKINKNKDKDKEDKGCKCCGILDCFKIETNKNNNINGNNNVIDNNKETSLNVGINSKK